MRDIKFKGKSVEDNKWVHGSLVIEYYNGQKRYGIKPVNDYRCYLVIPETIGQYAELQDKNKKEIYEGDIVENEDGIKGIVYYEDGCFWVKWENENEPHQLYWVNDEIEVVDNVYDNPELLERGG